MDFEEIATKFALPVLAMAGIVLVLIGIIKIFTKWRLNKKGASENKISQIMSYFYFIFAAAFSFAAVMVYYTIFHMDYVWEEIGKMSIATFSCTQALYPIYRDYGGRFLLTKFIGLFKGKNATADEMLALVEKVLVLTNDQKNAIKEQFKNK